jgi:hypothetical protein
MSAQDCSLLTRWSLYGEEDEDMVGEGIFKDGSEIDSLMICERAYVKQQSME